MRFLATNCRIAAESAVIEEMPIPRHDHRLSGETICAERKSWRAHPFRPAFEALESRLAPATLVVNSNADLAVNLGDAVVTLRDAIAAANANQQVSVGAASDQKGESDGDIIVFDPNVFGGAGATIVLTQGDLLIRDDLVIDGVAGVSGISTAVTIDGGGNSRIFAVNTAGFAGTENLVTLTGLTLQNGNGAGSLSNDGRGGAIFLLDDSNVTLNSLTVQNNAASGNLAADGGGGVYSLNSTVFVRSSTFVNNRATGALGGGGGLFQIGGWLNLGDTVIRNNLANGAAGSGGGILLDGGTLEVTGGSIHANTSVRAGGGLEATAVNRSFNATLTHVTIKGNSTSGVPGFPEAPNPPGNGGGIHISDPAGGAGNGTFLITDSVIDGNTAAQEGGGLWNDAGTSMTIDTTLIIGNKAEAANAANDAQGGGGVFNNGGIVNITKATITGNIVAGASPAGFDDGGAGIFNDGRISPGATITINNLLVTDNTATAANLSGGGILNIGDATIDFTYGSILTNSATQSGGGIDNINGTVHLKRVTLDANAAGNNGGGAHITGSGSLTATSSVFSHNTANFGGGLLSAGIVTLVNSTVSNNTATLDGGGIDVQAGSATIANSTIASNAAGGSGGGLKIDVGATGDINSAIIADNTAITSPNINGTVTVNFSLIENTTGATITGAANVLGLDPQLGPLQLNGGSTATHNLLPGSPAIDAGANSLALTYDQRDDPIARQFGIATDIGAIESSGSLTFAPPPANVTLAGPGVDSNTALVLAYYQVLLGRAGDASGVVLWVDELNRGVSPAQVVESFVTSEEYTSTLLFKYYRIFLGREGDSGGIHFWTSTLRSGVATTQVIAGFLASAEFQSTHVTTQSFVEDAYILLLGRNADPSGLDFWVASGQPPEKIALGILNSTEARSRTLDALYAQFFDRAVDPSGQSTWLPLAGDELTNLILSLGISDEFRLRTGA